MKIAIVGPSGSGKTTSLLRAKDKAGNILIEGVNPEETYFISCGNKLPPVRGFAQMYPPGKIEKGGRFLQTVSPEMVAKVVGKILAEQPQFKNIIIDDAQYIQAYMVMERAKEKKFEKFVDFAKALGDLLIIAGKYPNRNVIFTFHEEIKADESYKIKTAGKFVDEALNIDGLFDLVLYCRPEKKEGRVNYRYQIHSDGNTPAKTPLGLYSEDQMYTPNDFGIVLKEYEAYSNGDVNPDEKEQ